MRIAILGATGKVGRQIVEQARERGHNVTVLVRKPDAYRATDELDVLKADVLNPQAFPDLKGLDAIVSAIGISKGDGPGALEAGARVLTSAGPRVIWLGALGSGLSIGAGGRLYQSIMRMAVGKELAEKAEADEIALAAGAAVFHSPDLKNGPISPTRHLDLLKDYPRPVLPPRITRATLAALMLDEAETGTHDGRIVVPQA